MPHEILSKMYIYIPEDDQDPDPDRYAKKEVTNVEDDDPFREKEEEDEEPNKFVVHNFQHDLESVWWLLLWNLTARIEHAPSNDWAKEIFHNSLKLSEAREGCFERGIRLMMAKILIQSAKGFAKPIEGVRHFMKKQYTDRERRAQLRTFSSYVDIHHEFELFFDALQDEKPLAWREVALTVDNPYQKRDDVQNTAATKNLTADPSTLPPVPVGAATSKTPATQGKSPVPDNTQLAHPTRVKRELPDDEPSPPRRPGPSKRSKRGVRV